MTEVDPVKTGVVVITIIAVVVTMLVITLVAILREYSPNNKRRNALDRQANQDYANARGTSHLKILRDARARLNQADEETQKQISHLQGMLSSQEQEKQAQLQSALETHLVNTCFEVPGLGLTLKNAVIRTAFHGRLQDLRMAQSLVQGVGYNRQAAINAWIRTYEQQVPILLQGNFPGKSAVVKTYAANTATTKAQINQSEKRHKDLVECIGLIQQEITKLEAVTIKDFRAALENPAAYQVKIEAYQNGVFPEWEPIPDWFKALFVEEKPHA